MTLKLHILSGGAAQGVVKGIQRRFYEDTGAAIDGRFGAVGAMKEALLAGDACDVMITTEAMVGALAASGHLQGDSRAPLGRVRTGIAVPAGAPVPDIATPDALRAALRAADGIYFPDPERATAGIHFANVMRQLGVHDELQPRFRTHPNGAAAMQAMAAAGTPGLIGCTQVTEIRYTSGVTLAGLLPGEFELATVYTAAVAANTERPQLAGHFIALLAGETTRGLRVEGGFEV
jgi:molybdate transport system substrate-binding protein